MHFEFLLEEESAERVLDNLLPKIIMGEHTYRCIRFQGKKDLLNKLPLELKGYARWIPIDYRIVVLVDRDRDDCIELKNSLNKIAKRYDMHIDELKDINQMTSSDIQIGSILQLQRSN